MIILDKLPAVPYPPEILQLQSTDGFIAEFYRQCQQHASPHDAFDFLNELHEKYFGKPRFADYHSFKNQRNSRINKLKK